MGKAQSSGDSGTSRALWSSWASLRLRPGHPRPSDGPTRIHSSPFAGPRVGLLWPRGVPSDVELATLAKYPLLRESSAVIRAEKVSLEVILLEPAHARARSLGKARGLE